MKQSELIDIIKEVVNEESLKMEEGAGSKALDILQLALDVAGIPPSIGTPVNAANTAISLLRAASDKEKDEEKKHLIDAGLNAISMIPFGSVVKLVKLRALRKPAVAVARAIKGGSRATPRSYEPQIAQEGVGPVYTKDIKKDPKHVDDPDTGKPEHWRIKFQSAKDLSKHGTTEKSPVNEGITKKELREMIEEVLNEEAGPGQENWVKSNKERFKKKYGPKKGLEVLYGKSWNQSKSQGKTQQDEISLTPNARIPARMQLKHYVSKPVRIPETGEWIVKWMTSGKRDENKTYYTDDQKDAIDTYNQMVKAAQSMNASEK